MSTKSKEPKETDILLSRVDVALARSQRIIANWLPQKNSDSEKSTGEEKGFREDDAELGRDDSESFGVGWVPDSASDSIRKDASSLDHLRKQILGKRASNHSSKTPQQLPITHLQGLKSGSPSTTKPSIPRPDPVSEDEDEGRASAVIAKKRKFSKHQNGQSSSSHPGLDATSNDEQQLANENLAPRQLPPQPQREDEPEPASPKRASKSFLNQILSERERKRKKKKRNRNTS